FVKWYDTRHGPDLIGTGFYSCNAYHARAGGPFICNVYEIPDLGIFSSKAYVDVRTRDRQLTEEVLHKISNHSNTIYHQETVVGLPDAAFRPDSRPSRAGAVCAPVVATLRLDIEPAALPDFRAWFLAAQASDANARPGFLRSRLARQDGKHPLFPSKQAEWLVLTEWASLDDALAAGSAEEVFARYSRQAGKSLSRLEYNVAALSATLLNANAWTT
ncbi:MAG: hypothetical protein FJZ00_06400, partial [Candidatus Sericytochromatia bacterium]|nr:hypothetical protein [Candidatus Tanganyikabacteria bacterium]